MSVGIVIVNYRSADLTIDCLRSLAPEVALLGSAGPVRVIVTDNNSPDDSVMRLRLAVADNGWQAWATIQPLGRNGGFAYGNNAAIERLLAEEIPPDYILLLNPDTIVRPGAVQQLVTFMESRPDVGIVGSRLEDPDGTPQRSAFRFHTVASEFERGVRLGVVSKLLSGRVVAMPVVDEPAPCDAVAGAAMMVRRQVFGSIGPLDEKYFMYFEEIDFCLAARRGGWSCWYVPQSHVVHLVGAVSQVSGSKQQFKRRPAYWFEARRRYFVKNHGWLYAAAADVAFLTGFTFWRLRRLVTRKADSDPPRLLLDSLRHSVFIHRRATR